jgi:7,8-dihydropterin-6-yl-methyl-4-(beta-D-ribofuranosyl)aminobenzene 5'-phosphate synthase
MDIKVLFDSKKTSSQLLVGWGVSYFIDNQILFDAGERFGFLTWNMHALGLSLEQIEAVVISHEHWDHTNGLWAILNEKPGLPLYICPNFSLDFKSRAKSSSACLVEVEPLMKIADGIYTTGQIAAAHRYSHMPEQGLILRTPKGVTVVTGCAHSGILKIVEYVRRNIPDPIYLVLGGFHTLEGSESSMRSTVQGFKRLGVQNIAPGHCTGGDGVRLLKETYGEHCFEIKVGDTIEA